jgi:NAD(P)-dependent dehydrogenase (short-subunit alcohol dehydrogenase family)
LPRSLRSFASALGPPELGGGGSGLGCAAAIAYAREGADVAISYLPNEEPDAQDVIALIKAEGRTAVAIPASGGSGRP